MEWFVKTVCGTAGISLGGPVGAICGQAIAAFAASGAISPQRMKALEAKYYSARFDPQEKACMMFFVTMCALLGKIVKVDEKVTREELDAVVNVMLEKLKLSGPTLVFAKALFNASKKDHHSAKSIAEQFVAQSPRKSEANRTFMIEALWDVAMAGGAPHPAERRMIRSVAAIFGVDKSKLSYLDSSPDIGAAPATEEQKYAALGLAPGAPVKKIKPALHKRETVFDPGKLEKKGVPEEMKPFAEIKADSARISAADLLEKIKGLE